MSHQYTLLDAAAPRTITSTTDATPIVVTSASHGLVTGDRITINGHTTNTNANGTWIVTKVSDNTFSLDDSTATGGGAGGADGCFAKQNAICFIPDGYDAEVTIGTDGGGDAAMTIKFPLSDQEDPPDFAASQTIDNHYDYAYLNDLEDSANNITGDAGFVVATADDYRKLGVNTQGGRWFAAVPTAGTEGEVTVKVTIFKRN